MKHALVPLLASSLIATAAPQKGGPIWTDPDKAAGENPDFLVQGEYTKGGTGIQVVAVGKGQFLTSTYKGGLPGAGWDRSAISKSEGDTATVKKLIEGATRVQRRSPTLGQEPPEGATVLFDGKDAKGWKNGKLDGDTLESGAESLQHFGSFKLHLEFRLPFKPESKPGSQDRGNSGVYTHNRYETQVLDSFGMDYDIDAWDEKPPSHPKQWCGCLYKFKLADTPMCLPPLVWQTYDIDFTAAEFDDTGKKTKNARITVAHNGVTVHDDVELPKGTGAGGGRKEIPEGPIVLQGHGNPVRYRNIWIVETK